MRVTAEARTAQARTEPGTELRAEAGVTRLADIRAAGLIRHASEQVGSAIERSLPVSDELRALLPAGCLRRGGTVSVVARASEGERQRLSPAAGATSLLFALVAQASAAGSWCAAVGLPQLGLVAAAEAGVAVERLALVPSPGPEWASVVAALLDGVDIVVAATPGPVSAQVASRLVARARQRGSVLVSIGRWPGAEVTLEVVGTAWHGLRQGRGRLRSHEVEVVTQGRGAATRSRRARLWLPGAAETPAPVTLMPAHPVISAHPAA